MNALDRATFLAELGAPSRALIGMLHVGALPGSPAASQPLERIIETAVLEARVYAAAGYHAIFVENMHDRPYLRGAVGPETVAAMTAVVGAVRREVRLPLGVQVLAGANREALAVAAASGASFVRVEGFVFAHVADEGILESCAGELLRYRRSIAATHVHVLADIKKKHSAHAITADVSLAETARAAELFLADGVIVTGSATGVAADPADVDAVAAAVALPVLVGSGVTPENVAACAAAQGFIVGSFVKQDGLWSNPIDPGRALALARAVCALPDAAR
jgi:uncharacterized protein